ncbi:MAG TPA: NHLP bacteriocin system secretion protein [Gemmatimonadaceae bacterium]|nr:NHLP bacteriocin system secretion protein [Gemmatimonadaceae bacterium]
MNEQNLFRKASLDRLASPEQLDQLMQVTTPKGWVALLALAALLATAIVWGVVGSIPEQVSGQGVLLKSGGVLDIVPSAGGRVNDVSVSVGDVVHAGQVVARIAQPDLVAQLQQARSDLADLRAAYEDLVEFGKRDLALQTRSLEQQREGTEQAIDAARQSARWLADRMEAQEQLVQQGLITRSTLLTTREQYNAATQKIDQGENTLAQIKVQLLALHNDHQQKLADSEFRIDDATRHVAQLEQELKESSEVVSPYTGRILEIMTQQGTIVARGEPVMSLDLTGRSVKDLVAVIYVPALSGKQIRVGMPIQIAPTTVKPEEYGMMLGKVTYVSDFPATPKGMARVLKNEQLVTVLSGNGAPYEVHADLVVDPNTASRYRWSSSKGPPIRIRSGTLAVAKIQVREERPLGMVIPLLRRYTGL